ncbi:hypothetical protein EJC49_17290 [Aquibium carbonis]|uniref:Uncharacterized protein n=1 Tax=Aquibium carbonis TaxID=2495581 RepID=A0A3R9ZQA6_9HYPH|nr:hypothetical protein EJC49_17290 [Aquibium carbonis]
MPKLVSMLCRWLERVLEPRAVHREHDRTWLVDPLSHPAIARMDARELADLPFPRGTSPHSSEAGPVCRKHADRETCAA